MTTPSVTQSRRDFLKSQRRHGRWAGDRLRAAGRVTLCRGGGGGDVPPQRLYPHHTRQSSYRDLSVCPRWARACSTAIPMLVAEELEADWSKIRVEQAPADPAFANPIFKMQATGGSTSVRGHWEPMRKAGATAREMLIAAAADTWKVDRSTCHAESGTVIHASGKKLTYGQLANRAATMAVPAEVTLKDPQGFQAAWQRR